MYKMIKTDGKTHVYDFNGVEVTVTEQAELNFRDNKPYFDASGYDEEGGEYIVEWDIKKKHLKKFERDECIDDYSDMCNWDKPSNIVKL